ncbi:hypothetical protein [Anaerotignum sp.]|nr:hypothetical protein [Anaerotignum sp.]
MKKSKRKYRSLQDKLFGRAERSARLQNYPQRPRSKKNAILRPIKRS